MPTWREERESRHASVPHPRDAVFSGSLLPTRDIWEAGVRLGARAAFFLTVPTDMSGFSQVITSPLVRISVRSAATMNSS